MLWVFVAFFHEQVGDCRRVGDAAADGNINSCSYALLYVSEIADMKTRI